MSKPKIGAGQIPHEVVMAFLTTEGTTEERLAVEEAACAVVDDYTGCWKIAAGQEAREDNCKSYRAISQEEKQP